MFQPRFIKHAKLLRKGVTRFLHYKRDLLPAAKVDEIVGLRSELDAAIRQRDSARIDTLSKQLNEICERALPDARTSEWAENIEVFFVSIVIALGIRSYIAQPFQIPTGSMQPTLNGIRAESTPEDPNPGFIGKLGGFFTGTTYLNVVSDHDGELADKPLTEHKFLIFRPYTKVHFADGHTIKISAPIRQLTDELQFWAHVNADTEIGSNDTPDMRAAVNRRTGSRSHLRKGQVLARGIIQNGDHVIVNKFAYHFRRPSRGEVFVFTTKNIDGIEGGGNFDPHWGSQHYIKRLGAVPGDTAFIKDSRLYINGQIASEPGFQRVMTGTYIEPKDGYRGYEDAIVDPLSRRRRPVGEITLPEKRYLALGDNSYQSSDSRYWGAVPEQNVVGPGWLCYWPLTSHWGLIR